MQGFIHIFKVNQKQQPTFNVENLLKKYKSDSLLVSKRNNETIESFYFTNEHAYYPYFNRTTNMFTPVGVFTRNINQIEEFLINANNFERKAYVRDLGGQFALGFSDFLKDEVHLFTHIARIETLYSYVSKNLIIVGTDPLIISLLATNEQVEFDLNAMYSFILNGYYGDDMTPYKNVYALPGNSHIVINKSGVHIDQIDESYSNLLNTKYSKSDYDTLTDTFINGFNTQGKKDEFKMALTGGKDSRLIFAAMNSNKFDLSVFTNGFEDNPDVIIAKKIATMYDIKHKTTSPKISDENTISINIYKKIKKVMLATSGMVYGYEKVGLSSSFLGDRAFDGVGAELVKGGFANFVNSDDNSNKLKLVKTFNRNTEFLKLGENNPFGVFLKECTKNDQGLHKLQILYSLQYRTGRLTSAAKNAANYSKQSHSPFLDNKFLRDSLKIQYEDNKNEEIHYQILKRIDKRLIDIPFAKDRWRIEKNKPLIASDYKNWLNRQPYYPKTILGNYNWRQVQNNDKEILSEFKNIILSDSNHLIYQIVNYKLVEKLFAQSLKPKHMRFIWSLASIIIFINEIKNISNHQFDNTFNLILPSTSVSNYKNKKKIYDVSNKFITLNESLDIDDNNKINIKNFEKHRKLKLFSGKFNHSPSEIKFNNINKLTFRANLNHGNQISNLSGQIFFYHKGDKVKSFPLLVDKNETNTDLYFESKELQDYDSFRVLLNLNEVDKSDALLLNYSFYELTY